MAVLQYSSLFRREVEVQDFCPRQHLFFFSPTPFLPNNTHKQMEDITMPTPLNELTTYFSKRMHSNTGMIPLITFLKGPEVEYFIRWSDLFFSAPCTSSHWDIILQWLIWIWQVWAAAPQEGECFSAVPSHMKSFVHKPHSSPGFRDTAMSLFVYQIKQQ